eukprot:scaffold128_cov248-Pinguiococcus_pyrenoidosus.AAC.32
MFRASRAVDASDWRFGIYKPVLILCRRWQRNATRRNAASQGQSERQPAARRGVWTRGKARTSTRKGTLSGHTLCQFKNGRGLQPMACSEQSNFLPLLHSAPPELAPREHMDW